jgi:EAL domain-containing protein (putative c-di-GMP-specific phosphodiesterase class I)
MTATTAGRGRERRSPTPGAARKREAIRALKAGLAGEEIVLHYQPVVDIRDGHACAVEALLRWKPPSSGRPPLSELIYSAERSPVIFELENWVLGRGFADAADWRAEGLAGVRVNVNLSAREFPRADLAARLGRRIEAAGLEPADVGLEITETSGISRFDEVADQIERLAEMGIELWFDDFGTGHSSLEWLSRLPAYGMKVPGVFVERLGDPRCRIIVVRAIGLAHDLGLKVIAEGVETAAQRDFLVESGCDLFQGFLFYAPMAGDEVASVLGGDDGVTRSAPSSSDPRG